MQLHVVFGAEGLKQLLQMLPERACSDTDVKVQTVACLFCLLLLHFTYRMMLASTHCVSMHLFAGFFCVTSTVDGHWARVVGDERVWELRGSVSFLQAGCTYKLEAST